MSNSNSTDETRIKMVNKFNTILNNLRLSKIIEKGVYNYIIDTAKQKAITRLWEDKVFNNLYFKKERYDLSEVGRVKLNSKLNLKRSLFIQWPFFMTKYIIRT